SHGLWQRRFASARDVIGQDILVDGAPHTVVGVMPPSFRHPYRADLWVPLALRIDPTQATGHFLYAPARLKAGVTIEMARRSMRALCERLAREFPSPNNAREATVVPLHASFVRDLQPKMLAITAAAVFVLLIVGANLAGLLLARHLEREAETGLRAALGASRGRLVGTFLLESLVLTIAGSVAGVLLAFWLTGPVVALSPMASDTTGSALREFDSSVRIDGPVLGASIAAALVVGLGFGLVPAWRGSRGDLQAVLKGSGRGATLDLGTRRLFSALVVSEIAVAVVLLVATGLMVRSFRNLVNERWGFAIENRVAFDVTFSGRIRPEHEARVTFVEQALERLRGLPEVASATATTPDLVALGRSLAAITPQGSTPPAARGFFLVNHRLVFPGYFEDSGIPIVHGRPIERSDGAGGQRVAVVSEAFARRYWPGQDAIGRTIKRGRPDDPRPPYVVVGVAADVKGIADSTDGDVPGVWYLPYVQNAGFLTDDVTFVVHARVPAESLLRQVRAALAAIDPGLAPYGFTTLERKVGDTYVEDRFALLLVGLFGVLGLVLSAIGLYGLLSFQVARRTREMGVRAALGAESQDILALVFRQGASLLGAGLAAGLVLASAAARLLASQLHGVGPQDPMAHLVAGAVLSLAAALACWLPARRAARVDPMIALRTD
ncbi:MAG TPA: ADOP family duplicated permease, partial [Vicinamibacteria bacterium]|nr:ADOP family duplicated permease [Vicinamibacteria bacterium]